MFTFAISLILSMLSVSMVTPAPALASVVQKPHVEVELVPETLWVRPGLSFWVALRLKMEPGWHTYWTNPGDSGAMTSVDWTLPQGFSAGPIEWPYPMRLPVPPLVNFGYEGEVFLLTRIDPPAKLTSKDVHLEAHAEWLICKETCIPGKAKVELSLPVQARDPALNPDWAESFRAARRTVPGSAEGWTIRAESSGKDFVLKATAPKGSPFVTADDAVFFPYEAGWIEPSAPLRVSAMGEQVRLETRQVKDLAEPPARAQGVLVVSREGRAIQVDVPLVRVESTSLWMMLLFAVVGGLILNIMPCVFPVISMKILGFVEISHHDRRQVRHHGLMFCLGALLSFWALAGLLLLLRAGGQSLGWGFQLQSPAFIVCLAVLFFFLGLNLMGFFEIGTRVMGIGQGLASRKTLSGSFFSGVLATIVATPCTAPFMGAAMGFALSQSAWISLLIFTGIAFGMLIPYLILSAVPELLRFLPKPGRWMETFKQFLAFPLFATVLWLAWVLGIQSGVDAVIALLGALIVCSMAVWIRQRWNSSPWSWAIAVLLALAGLGVAILYAGSRDQRVTTVENGRPSGGIEIAGMPAEKFSKEIVASLRVQGNPVFVDFTAAWCVTCQVNERVVFASSAVKERFASLGVKLVKADWTHNDETISRALEEHGRNGVPLYLLYPADPARDPMILPEVLTSGIVLNALQKLEN